MNKHASDLLEELRCNMASQLHLQCDFISCALPSPFNIIIIIIILTNCIIRRRRYPSISMRRWRSAGVSSPVELRSLDRVCGRRAVVQAVSLPSPRGRWIQADDERRYCLGTNGVAGVTGVASCQTAFGTSALISCWGLLP